MSRSANPGVHYEVKREVGCRAIAIVLSALAIFSVPCAGSADEITGTYAHVRASLALVIADEGKKIGLGTAFCIASSSNASYFLTNNHVVAGAKSIALRLEQDPKVLHKGVVIRHSVPPLDAAIVRVDYGEVPTLVLSTINPPEGQAIAIAGYPYFQITVAQEKGGLTPSVHLGSVNALPFDGYYIEHDALADHGNSGGPLFDQATGLVYGIVTYGIQSKESQAVQNNLAISVAAIFDFMSNAGIAYTSASPEAYVPTSTDAMNGLQSGGAAQTTSDAPTSAPGVLRDAPGAYRFLMTHGNIQLSPGAQPISDAIDQRLEDALGSLSGSTIVTDQIDDFDPDTISAACAKSNVVGVVGVGDTWSGKITVITDVMSGSLVINVYDCSGQIWYSTIKNKRQVFPYGSVTNQYQSVMFALADQAVADLQSQTANNPSALKNFVRYGIPIADGYKSPLFWLLAAPGGAYVGVIPRFSTAARAGLQLNDVVTTINDHPTAGLTQVEVNNLMNQVITEGGKWDLAVSTADGNTARIKFESEDIRWYLTHPLKP